MAATGRLAQGLTSGRAGESVERRESRRQGTFTVLGPEELAARAHRRKVSRMIGLGASVVVVALLAIAGAQAFIAAHQVRLDALEQELDGAVAKNQSLELVRARLDAPNRVLEIAQGTLKMAAPATVQYLTPVNPGPSVATAAAARAASRTAMTKTVSSSAPTGEPTSRRPSPSTRATAPVAKADRSGVPAVTP